MPNTPAEPGWYEDAKAWAARSMLVMASINCSRCGTFLAHVDIRTESTMRGDQAALAAKRALKTWEPTYICTDCQDQDEAAAQREAHPPFDVEVRTLPIETAQLTPEQIAAWKAIPPASDEELAAIRAETPEEGEAAAQAILRAAAPRRRRS